MLLTCADPLSAQVEDRDGALQGAWEQLNRGELLGALVRVQDLPRQTARSELEAEAFYLGRRFQAARDAAREGLALDPTQARLALRALQASLWLGDPHAARHDQAALERAVAEGVEAEHRGAWGDLLRQHGSEIEALETRERVVAGARQRVRLLVAVLGPLALLSLVLALVGSLRRAGGSA